MTIEVLFPEICNLFGDSMNAEYLHRAIPEATIIYTSLKMRPRFADEKVEMIYMGSMTESSQALAAEVLNKHKERILQLIDMDVVFLITGNAVELFGEKIENEDGSSIITMGLFSLYAKRQMMKRYSSIYLGKFDDMEIVGFKSQFAHNYQSGKSEVEALFETQRGAGRKPGQKEEGIRINNFLATNVLGPILPLNPPFTHYILKLLGISRRELPYEKEALAAYEARLKEFKDPKTGAEYS